jgi:3-hydroxyacyl-CoA dehydrogenase
MSAAGFHTAAVLGAGTMGAQIAAHFANAGLRTVLLDVTPEAARDGLNRAAALKPAPFFTPDTASLVSTGGFDADLPSIASADWIVEAIVERLDAKRDLFARVEVIRHPGSVVSSNTSGIPIGALAEGRTENFRRHFLGTHFFNPPRYLHLLELIPTADTERAVLDRVRHFADVHLGKGVVVARDTPNFIANHLGVYSVLQVLRALESGKYTVEEIDAITGPALGRPKSATLRTLDIAGIDILVHVARNLSWDVPALVTTLVERGWIGEKAGQGFYKRQKSAGGASEILALDPATMTYRRQQTPRIPSLEAAKAIDDVRERTRMLFDARDKAGEFLRDTLVPMLDYAARIAPSIAYSADDVDRVMRWGFGWPLGPFELRQLLGLDTPVARPFEDREPVAPLGGRERKILKKNAAASLVDLDDGVLAVALHSKRNVIGVDTGQMLQAGLDEAARNFAALVVCTDAPDFSVGANLMLVLLEAQEGNWDEIDAMVRTFQRLSLSIARSPVPVVVATAGLTLGGGCEFAMHADRVQASAESYIGLVETGVGLIPAGGGTKELLARTMADLPRADADLLPYVQRVFETIGFAKVSTSAPEARTLGLLREVDRVTMNRDHLIADAKAVALERAAEGYQPAPPRTAIPVGGEGVLAALKLGIHLAWRAGRISDHDAVVGRALARVLAGGTAPHPTNVSEQQLLDLEREAFLKLCGERKTLERIQYTLKTGKPLRN